MNNKKCYSRFFPYYTRAFLLLFLQGPLSFSADYLNMDKISRIHVVDKFLAMLLSALELIQIILIFLYSGQKTVFLWMYSIGFFMAIFSFLQSAAAQTLTNLDDFIFWHCLWHIYPIVAIIIASVERIISKRDVKADNKVHYPDLSDLVLKIDYSGKKEVF